MQLSTQRSKLCSTERRRQHSSRLSFEGRTPANSAQRWLVDCTVTSPTHPIGAGRIAARDQRQLGDRSTVVSQHWSRDQRRPDSTVVAGHADADANRF